ncbi:MAG: Ribosome-associated ATPase RbbA, domain 2 [Nitrospira sp.]|jgi:ABC-2 type transport system permease protein/ribosome-dependent ATPase|nr:MAG: Ribosome-associated ATPase RbbA, domain 2 [Nitrospira sp.]
MNLKRIAAVASKEWREVTRDRLFLLLAFLMPALWMVVFGYGLVLDVENIPFAVLDRDHSELSRDYVYRFLQSRYFSVQGSLSSEAEADDWLLRGKARAVIIVPEQFQERLQAGRSVDVQTLIDGVFPLRADIIKGYIIAINSAVNEDLLVDHLARSRGISRQEAQRLSRRITLDVRYLYNEEVRSAWSTVPALVMFALMVSSPLLTALGVVREKETGSIYNIYSATVSRLEFLVGKLTPYVMISASNIVLLWLIAVSLFAVPFKGSLLFFLAASFLFVLTSTGIGLIVSLLVNTQQAALIIAVVVATVPTILFSGLIVPVSSLNRSAQFQAHLFPGMYYTNIVRGTFLKNVGPMVLWTDVLALGLYAAVLGVIGYRLFSKRPRS